jgi:hypothetical protein
MSPVATLLLSGLAAATAPAPPQPTPMPVDPDRSALKRWLDKPVHASRLLDDMEKPETWTHQGPGRMSLTADRCRDGRQSVRLASRTVTDTPNVKAGRPHGEASLRRVVPGEDWSAFNRVSIWVYPTMPGHKTGSVVLKLSNDGREKIPRMWTHGPMHYALVKPGQWNRIVWEIAHLTRDKVTGLDLIYRLQGSEPGASEDVSFDWDRLELERVDADVYEGWNVWDGRIAFCHSGYEPDAPKTAVASRLKGDRFELVEHPGGKVALTKPLRTARTPLGEFQVLDFGEARQPGLYVLRAGGVTTPPFPIDPDCWRGTLWKTVNFFYCERCGDRIAGVHDVCHADWQAEHGGKRLGINGGWHDAGDLSQGLINTGEAVHAMLALAESIRTRDRPLSDRLLQEALWGLDWVEKTRFGDGHRLTWATMDYWTDGKTGTADDTLGQTGDGPAENAVGAAASAAAARAVKTADPPRAARSLQAAREDWAFAMKGLRSPNVEALGTAVLASVELCRATGEETYAEKAAELARLLVDSQQTAYLDGAVPLAGFFHTSPKKDRILNYMHRGHDQAPVVALAELCRLRPAHPDWMRWYAAVALHSEYQRTVAALQEPYGLLPAGVYRLSDNPAQVGNGLKLSETHALRRFPVWGDLRGHFGVLLSQTKALSTAARLRNRRELMDLGRLQLQWVVGRNPFAQSTMFGEGYDYAPQYTALSGDIAGSLPVGIQTKYDLDVPYWPVTNCWNYKEVWVHPSSRWLFVMADLLADPPAPGTCDVELAAREEGGAVTITASLRGSGRHELALRAFNLEVDAAPRPVDLKPGTPAAVAWTARVLQAGTPWVAAAVPDGDTSRVRDVVGYKSPPGAR